MYLFGERFGELKPVWPTICQGLVDGLRAMAVDVIKQDPLSGHLFVFRKKNGGRLKVLYWGGDPAKQLKELMPAYSAAATAAAK